MHLRFSRLCKLNLPKVFLPYTEGKDMEQKELQGKQPRRKFLASILAGAAGVATVLLAPRRARAEAKRPVASESETGPILYRRTEEAERYYRTLYR